MKENKEEIEQENILFGYKIPEMKPFDTANISLIMDCLISVLKTVNLYLYVEIIRQTVITFHFMKSLVWIELVFIFMFFGLELEET